MAGVGGLREFQVWDGCLSIEAAKESLRPCIDCLSMHETEWASIACLRLFVAWDAHALSKSRTLTGLHSAWHLCCMPGRKWLVLPLNTTSQSSVRPRYEHVEPSLKVHG